MAWISFQPVGAGEPGALWTVYVTDVQQRLLFAPDLDVHAPYIGTMLAMMFVVWRLFPSRARVA